MGNAALDRRSAIERSRDPIMPFWWEALVAAATLFALGMLIVDFRGGRSESARAAIAALDGALCVLFAFDFGWRFSRSTDRRGFVRRNWIDLAAALPLSHALRGARVVRLLRLARLLRAVALVRRLRWTLSPSTAQGAFAWLGVLTTVMWIAAAFAFYLVERDHNPNLRGPEDALWWSLTTLSTVGYGDVYPTTVAGRVVAALTMMFGIGVLGSFVGTMASWFVSLRERGRRGLRGYAMRNHLLVLGWNEKARTSIEEFRHDPRHDGEHVVIVADLETIPIEDNQTRFVRGQPSRREVLTRASAELASTAIVFATASHDPRSDHETALTVLMLRRLNPTVRISAELVASENREHLEHAGCDAIIEPTSVAAMLLVRAVQDVGISSVVTEMLDTHIGSQLYRTPVPKEFEGKTFREFALAMVERSRVVIALARGSELFLCPSPDARIQPNDDAFVICHDLP